MRRGVGAVGAAAGETARRHRQGQHSTTTPQGGKGTHTPSSYRRGGILDHRPWRGGRGGRGGAAERVTINGFDRV